MKRLIAVSVGLVWGGAALAADPIPSRQPAGPAVTFRSIGATNVTQPLPTAMSAALPVNGAYPVAGDPASCAGAGCANASCDRTCLERFADWLCYRPGPRVLPLCTPNMYHAPLRHYFPCHPGQCYAVGGCNPQAGCGASGCGSANCAGRPGLFAGRLSVFNRPAAPAPVEYAANPQSVPPQTGAVPAQRTVAAARLTLRDRMMGMFSSLWPETPYVAFQNPTDGTGPTVVPAPNGYRYATPGMMPAATGPQAGMVQAGHQQPAVNHPLTRQ